MNGFSLRTGLVFNLDGVRVRIERLQPDGQILLQRIDDGQLILSSQSALLNAYAAGKISVMSPNTAETSVPALTARPLADLPEDVRVELRRRMHYLDWFAEHGGFVFTAEILKPLIAEAAREISDPQQPSPTTFYRWFSRHRAAKDVRALIPRYDKRGSRNSKQDERVLELFAAAIEEAYKASPAANKLQQENLHRLPEDHLHCPSRRTLYRLFDKLEAYEKITLREGRAAADRCLRISKRGPDVKEILERVEVDHTPLDLFLLDEHTRLPRGWPTANVIVGNPPFLGDKMMRGELGDDYVNTLRKTYDGRVPGGADLVTYWFEKARAQIEAGELHAAGLVSTNSIRGGANRKVLDRISDTTRIFEAWSDEEWINEGAEVRVPLIGFGEIGVQSEVCKLDGILVPSIFADLTAGVGVDLTKALRLAENIGTCFIGTQKSGSFDITGELARNFLSLPNPNGKPNAEVVIPWVNGLDITRRPAGKWIIDFGVDRTVEESALFEGPFNHIQTEVKAALDAKKVKWTIEGKDTKHLDRQLETWWLLWCPRPEMRTALTPRTRYIATARNGKHRIFVWLPKVTQPDSQVVAVARDDDTTFGILASRFHELWSLGVCTWLGVGNDPRYTPTTCFETFPFPSGLTPRDTAYAAPSGKLADAIAAAAKHLSDTRDSWLNPTDWVDWVITKEEEKAGFPRRPVA